MSQQSDLYVFFVEQGILRTSTVHDWLARQNTLHYIYPQHPRVAAIQYLPANQDLLRNILPLYIFLLQVHFQEPNNEVQSLAWLFFLQ